MNISKLDQIYGSYLGLLLGDSLSLPHIHSKKSINKYTGLLEFPPEYKIKFYPSKYGYIGQVSNEITMLISCMRVISNFEIQTDSNIEHNLILEYINWANTTNFALDKNTFKLFKGIKKVDTFNKNKCKYKASDTNYCLVRSFSYILAKWYYPNNYEKLSIIDTSITYDNDISIESTRIYLKIVDKLLEKKEIFVILNELDSQNHIFQEMFDDIKKLRNETYYFDKPNKIINSLYISLYVLYKTEKNAYTFSQSMTYLIKSLDGDFHVNCLITGSLLGLYFGYEKILSEEINKNNLAIILNSDKEKSELIYDPKYHPSVGFDILKLFSKKFLP